jgi:zinc D-Ala-D-Ala carboxypeptidase
MNLTQNFTLSEMTKSETALRYGMANDPTDTEIENMRLLCEKVLQPVRNYYGMGVKVNSGYRHPLVNAKVGGSATSDHCKAWRQTLKFLALPTLIWHNGSKTIVSLNSLY